MRNILKITMIALVMAVIFAVVNTAIAVYPTYTGLQYPQTAFSSVKGAVTGRVMTSANGTVGISGAYVAIVNASNASQEYYNTTSNANGNYQITGISSTYSSVLLEGPYGQTGPDYYLGTGMYRIYANKSPYGEGYSQEFGVDVNNSAAATTSVLILPPASYVTSYGPQTVWSALDRSGVATGRVTTSVNGTVGIGGAYVAIVNASNVSEEYYNTTSDANGNYLITGLNATYSSVLLEGPSGVSGDYSDYRRGQAMYKIYANKTPYGKGYSKEFGIDANESATATTSVVIFPKPARVELKAERSYLSTDSLDNITITAYMYDALGNQVSDGYLVNFTVGNATNNSFMQGGFPTYQGPYANGSLDYAGNTNNYYQGATKDNIGAASVQFGWVNNTYGGDSSTIWAYWYDSANPTNSALVNASIKVCYYTGTTRIVGFTVNTTQLNSSSTIKASYTLINADPAGNDVRLVVYNSNNSPVRTIDAGVQGNGSYNLTWDGRYDYGYYAPDGVYTLKVFVYSKDRLPTNLKKQWGLLNMPFGVAVDPAGNVYVTDPLQNATKRVSPDGTIVTLSSDFYYPYGAAIDAQGNIYVADTGNDAIKVIYPNGSIKSLGSGFKNPTGVAVDSAGNVYVADMGNNATKRIAPDGTIVTLGSNITSPFGIDVDSAGNVYVTELYEGSVKVIRPDNTVRTLPNISDMPAGVAVDSAGNVYVSDPWNGSVVELYTNNTTRTVHAGFRMPVGITVDAHDNLYVADADRNQVVKICPDGSITAIETAFTAPWSIACGANGDLYVADAGPSYGNGTIKVIYANGTIGKLYDGFYYLTGLAVDHSGNVYVADSGATAIQVFYPDGTNKTLGSKISYPYSVAVDALGNVYATDAYNDSVIKISPDNTTKKWGGYFFYPRGIAADSAGNVYVTTFWDGVLKIYPNNTTVTLARWIGGGFLEGAAADSSGNVYVTDRWSNEVDMIQPDGTVIPLGTGFNSPIGIAVGSDGDLYVTDNNGISEFAPPLFIASDPISVNVTGLNQVSYTYHLYKGWNMISVPFELANSSMDSFFPISVRSKVTDMWWYDHGTWVYYSGTDGYSPNYAHLTNVEPGKGYYVLVTDDVTFTVTGTPSVSSVPSVGTGWTLFGINGMNSIDPTTVYSNNLDMWYLEKGTWYYYSAKDGYSSNYPHLTSLDPGKGYWVNYG